MGFAVDRTECNRAEVSLYINGKVERVTTVQVEGLHKVDLYPAITGRAPTALRVNWGGSVPFRVKIPDFPSVLSYAQKSGNDRSSKKAAATDEQRSRAAQAAYDGDIATLQKLAAISNLRVNDPVPERLVFFASSPH